MSRLPSFSFVAICVLALGKICAAQCDGEDCEAAPPRLLQQSLPPVSNVDFTDLDLEFTQIGGTVSWTPPTNVFEVSGYVVYLADSSGMPPHTHLGTVPVGTHQFAIAINTTLTPYTHIFVHTRSVLGMNPYGTGFKVCDVSGEQTLDIVNSQSVTGHWGISELKFYEHPDCTGPQMKWAQPAGAESMDQYPIELAFDSNAATSWVSNQSDNPSQSLSVGVVGVCRAEEVRCVYVRQCYPGRYAECQYKPATRTTGIVLRVHGASIMEWRVLPSNDLDRKLSEEYLIVSGRRRRAAFAVLSEPGQRPEQQTNVAFTSR